MSDKPITWVSEADELPPIAQPVLLASPRQHGEFWDVSVAMILVKHEGVAPRPIKAGTRWSSDFWWSRSNQGRDTLIVTGNSWWSYLDQIPLPPGAVHEASRGHRYIRQVGDVFVPQAETRDE